MEETKESLQTQQEKDVKVEDGRVKAQSEFTVTDVTAALESYVATSQEDTAIKIALTSHTPKVQGSPLSRNDLKYATLKWFNLFYRFPH